MLQRFAEPVGIGALMRRPPQSPQRDHVLLCGLVQVEMRKVFPRLVVAADLWGDGRVPPAPPRVARPPTTHSLGGLRAERHK